MYGSVHAYICICVRVCVCAYHIVCMCINMCMCIYIYITYVCVCAHANVYAYAMCMYMCMPMFFASDANQSPTGVTDRGFEIFSSRSVNSKGRRQRYLAHKNGIVNCASLVYSHD